MDRSRVPREYVGRSVGSRSSARNGVVFPDDVSVDELDPEIRRDLRSLERSGADRVAKHLVMAGRLLFDDPEQALVHAREARAGAGRIGLVREAVGVVAYYNGEWAEALTEFRTARRILGGVELLPLIADCERGVGRPEKAIELAHSAEGRELIGDVAVEFAIVIAGAYADLGELEKARLLLEQQNLSPEQQGEQAARLFYAYAQTLCALGRIDDAGIWFLNAAAADIEDVTDAEDRLVELAGDNT